MSDDGKLDKIKEQYVDEVLGIVPLSQAVFIVLMTLVADRIVTGKAPDFITAMLALGLKNSLGPDNGEFWNVSFFSIVLAFGLALINMLLLRISLQISIRRSKISSAIIRWNRAAALHVADLSEAQKNAVLASFKDEVALRTKKYKAKRIATEIVFSLAAVSSYATLLLITINHRNGSGTRWSWPEFLFLICAILTALGSHRHSLQYAISKVIPLKVYLGAISGELVFFEDVSG